MRQRVAEPVRDFQPGRDTLAVVGLGYVGVALAAAFADAGFAVLGFDTDPSRRAALREGTSPFRSHEPELEATLQRAHARLSAPTDLTQLAAAAVVFVCVETPIDADHRPRYAALRHALADIGPHLAAGTLVVVESTLAPGTMRSVVVPALRAATAGRSDHGVFVGHCPERVTAGRLLYNLRHMARVCGGESPAVAEAMIALYKHIVEGELDAADLETAELVKTAENAYRDVAIAFANELALICERAGGDFLRVRELVNKSPGREVLFAGAGVGGHCIPKDSWLLAHGAPELDPWLLAAARRRNDEMPAQVLARTRAALGGTLAGRRIAVLGYTYREDTDDARDTPSARFVELARAGDAEVTIHDPFVPSYATRETVAAEGADALVILVSHAQYKHLPLAELARAMRTPILVDARSVVSLVDARAAGFTVHRLGLASPR